MQFDNVTFSGGFSIVPPPPPPEAYGYWAAGGPGVVNTNVFRIAFSNDTTSSTRGSIAFPVGSLNQSGTGNDQFGYWGGGRGPDASLSTSSIWRITFATDTNNGIGRGSLSAGRYNMGTVTDGTTNGWFGGGLAFPAMLSRVDRITYSNDTATATVRGPLTAGKYNLIGIGNTSFGWFTGGTIGGFPTIQYSTVDRITFATDSATASVRGPLTSPVRAHGGTGNSDFGWLTGGNTPRISSISRIQYSTDTTTSTLRGPFTRTRNQAAGTGNTNYGWFGGGYSAGNPGSSVDRIEYASDTNTALLRGVLPANGYYCDSATTGLI